MLPPMGILKNLTYDSANDIATHCERRHGYYRHERQAGCVQPHAVHVVGRNPVPFGRVAALVVYDHAHQRGDQRGGQRTAKGDPHRLYGLNGYCKRAHHAHYDQRKQRVKRYCHQLDFNKRARNKGRYARRGEHQRNYQRRHVHLVPILLFYGKLADYEGYGKRYRQPQYHRSAGRSGVLEVGKVVYNVRPYRGRHEGRKHKTSFYRRELKSAPGVMRAHSKFYSYVLSLNHYVADSKGMISAQAVCAGHPRR